MVAHTKILQRIAKNMKALQPPGEEIKYLTRFNIDNTELLSLAKDVIRSRKEAHNGRKSR